MYEEVNDPPETMPSRPSRIMAEVEQLDRNIDRLGELVENVAKTLSPILLPEPSLVSAIPEGPPREETEPEAQLAGRILAANRLLARHRTVLERVAERIDL